MYKEKRLGHQVGLVKVVQTFMASRAFGIWIPSVTQGCGVEDDGKYGMRNDSYT
jgi:hypothetical protein